MDNHHFWWLNHLNPLFQWPFMVRLRSSMHWILKISHWFLPKSSPCFSPNKNRVPAQPGTPSISAKGSTNGQPITRFAKTDLDRVPPGRMIMSDLEGNIWIILNIFLRCLRRFFFLQQWLLPGLLVDWISLENVSLLRAFCTGYTSFTQFPRERCCPQGILPEWTRFRIKGIFQKRVIDDEEWSSELLPLLVDWFLLPSGNLLQFAIENCHLVRTNIYPLKMSDFPIFP